MANYWNGKGWTITLATWAGPSSKDFYTLDPRVRRVWLDVQTPGSSASAKLRAYWRRVLKLRTLLRQARPDAVLSFIDTSNVMTLFAGMGLRIRIVVSERINGAVFASIPWGWRLLRRMTYWQADAVVAQTRDAAHWVSGVCGVNAIAIPNPLRALPDVEYAREPMILAVGRLTRQKGFDVLIRAFSKVYSGFSDWRLVIVGSGPELPVLRRLCADLNVTSRVEFRDPEQNIESWMARAGLVVQSSRFEGFPNVVLEAMGMGAAVISSDCRSGPSEIIQDGINGRLVPVEDVAALARAIEELLREPALRARFGREARKVRVTFRQEVVMREWERCVAPARLAVSSVSAAE